jgi:hypothetical protein
VLDQVLPKSCDGHPLRVYNLWSMVVFMIKVQIGRKG